MARKMITTQTRRWDKLDIERLKYYSKFYGDNLIQIADKFPTRSFNAVSMALKQLECGKLGHKEKRSKKKHLNPNPPTILTYILVHNYYDEDIRHGMTKAEAVEDIAETLNRSQDWVKKALKIDIRKYMEKDEEKENEEMELRHTYIR